jgi:hypothetical protein
MLIVFRALGFSTFWNVVAGNDFVPRLNFVETARVLKAVKSWMLTGRWKKKC